MLNIIHSAKEDGSTYEQISAVTPVPTGLTIPPQVNKSVEISYESFNETEFNELPDWLKTMMKNSLEYKEMKNPSPKPVEPKAAKLEPIGEPDDLPF